MCKINIKSGQKRLIESKPRLLLNLLVESTQNSEAEKPCVSQRKTKAEKSPAENEHGNAFNGGDVPLSLQAGKLLTIVHWESFK